jgi:FrmR/RcnR family transcriptional regulator, repressor of frmRAB operon
MPNIARRKSQLVSRAKKIVAQFEMVQRAIEEGADRPEVLRRLSAARNWANCLMADLLEEHIMNQVASNLPASGDPSDTIYEIVRTYLK